MNILHSMTKGFLNLTDTLSFSKGGTMQQVRNGRKAGFALLILVSLITFLFVTMFTAKSLSDAAFLAVVGGITGTFVTYCSANVASKKHEKKDCPESATDTPQPPSQG